MKLFQVPVEANEPGKYTFSTNLDGQTYSFEFAYNKRIDGFHFSVLDASFLPIISNIPCLSYIQQMTTKYAFNDLFPFGDMWFSSATADDGEDANFLTMSKTVFCFYMSIREEIVGG